MGVSMFNAIQRSCRPALRRIAGDRRGSTAVTMALATTMLLGFAGVGVDVAVWETSKRDMQGAADQAAFSAAISSGAGTAYATTNAKAVTADMGFVDGEGGVAVTVHNPPTAGGYAGNGTAWEVIITKPQKMWFANLFLGSNPSATARAVALPVGGTYCILVLDPTANQAMDLQGTPSVNTPNCSIQVNSNNAQALTLNGSPSVSASTVSVVGGYNTGNAGHIYANVKTGAAPVADPYVVRPMPPQPVLCVPPPTVNIAGVTTYSQGCYPTGIRITNNGTYKFLPGIYWIPSGQELKITKGTTTGNGVTFVLVGTASVDFGSNSTVDLKAPAVGPTAGMIFFQDRNAPLSNVTRYMGGATQKFTGALYFPNTAMEYQGNAASQDCAQLIVRQVKFVGTSGFSSNCAGVGITPISSLNVALAE